MFSFIRETTVDERDLPVVEGTVLDPESAQVAAIDEDGGCDCRSLVRLVNPTVLILRHGAKLALPCVVGREVNSCQLHSRNGHIRARKVARLRSSS